MNTKFKKILELAEELKREVIAFGIESTLHRHDPDPETFAWLDLTNPESFPEPYKEGATRTESLEMIFLMFILDLKSNASYLEDLISVFQKGFLEKFSAQNQQVLLMMREDLEKGQLTSQSPSMKIFLDCLKLSGSLDIKKKDFYIACNTETLILAQYALGKITPLAAAKKILEKIYETRQPVSAEQLKTVRTLLVRGAYIEKRRGQFRLAHELDILQACADKNQEPQRTSTPYFSVQRLG